MSKSSRIRRRNSNHYLGVGKNNMSYVKTNGYGDYKDKEYNHKNDIPNYQVNLVHNIKAHESKLFVKTPHLGSKKVRVLKSKVK